VPVVNTLTTSMASVAVLPIIAVVPYTARQERVAKTCSEAEVPVPVEPVPFATSVLDPVGPDVGVAPLSVEALRIVPPSLSRHTTHYLSYQATGRTQFDQLVGRDWLS
jgi:hypothetical protein